MTLSTRGRGDTHKQTTDRIDGHILPEYRPHLDTRRLVPLLPLFRLTPRYLHTSQSEHLLSFSPRLTWQSLQYSWGAGLAIFPSGEVFWEKILGDDQVRKPKKLVQGGL